ncbi:unnamed protein product [Amoebophrya sp. A25]|nr:unnamed protein product [Amoebophrya sp. A25]|eukprot:GSA25T00020121001.1
MAKNAGHGGRGTKQRHFNKAALPGMGRQKVVKGGLKLGSAFKNSNASTKVGRSGDPSKESVKSGGQQRSRNTIKRLQMYSQKAPNARDLHQQMLKPQRIEPDRRWFGNTRVITQTKMQEFRDEMGKEVNDPYRVVLKTSKLPMSLLTDSLKNDKMDLLKVESYQDTFGSKKLRKKPKLVSENLEQLMEKVNTEQTRYSEISHQDKQLRFDLNSGFENSKSYEGHDNEEIFLKGTSRRIWRELYKVVDSSDVIIQVLDARDPIGTRCLHLEKNIQKNHPGKHVVLLLNKCDLIPNWATRRWCEILRKERPTLAFHASVTNPFGKSALIQLLRQFAKLMKDKKQIQVGLIGYPNVGKSSVINTLKKKDVCKAAPIPGETKVWQYIALTKKIYAIDCPGIVPLTAADFAQDTAKVLKGVVRAEKLEAPSAYIDEVVTRVKHKYLRAKYNLPESMTWTDGEDFLTQLATKMGKLRKGGEPDLEITARIVLYDWQRGRIPYFVPPPDASGNIRDVVEDEIEDAEKVMQIEEAAKDGADKKKTEDISATTEDAEAAASPLASDATTTEPGSEGKQSAENEELEAEVDAVMEAALAKTSKDAEDDEDDHAGMGDEDGEKSEFSDDEADGDDDDGIKDIHDIRNDFSSLKCSMAFDAEDMGDHSSDDVEVEDANGQNKATISSLKRGAAGSSSSGRQEGATNKASKKSKFRTKKKRAAEKALAMNSDDSDVDDDSPVMQRQPSSKRRKQNKKNSKAASNSSATTSTSPTASTSEVSSKNADRKSGKKSKTKTGLEDNASKVVRQDPQRGLVVDWDRALEEFA